MEKLGFRSIKPWKNSPMISNSSLLALLPTQASTLASDVDLITIALVLLCGAVTFGLMSAIAFFVVRYREGSVVDRSPVRGVELKLEIFWSTVPLLIFICLFVWGAERYLEMHSVPAGASEIYVTAKQWMWKFQHANGTQELGELHVPLGRPIKLVMISQDVIHSFYVPAFRMKQDVLPDRYTYTWFQATKPGKYRLFCTQFCGTEHAAMGGDIIVLPEAEFQQWASIGVSQVSLRGSGDYVKQGQTVFERHGCISCHGSDSVVRAPSLNGLYGSRVFLDNGDSLVADENYIRESVLEPEVKIVKGYENIMPSFRGQISEEEMVSLVEYLKYSKTMSIKSMEKERGGRE